MFHLCLIYIYAFLLLFFFGQSSMFWHCSPIQISFAFVMPFLISWLTALYCAIPSLSLLLFLFISFLRLAHRSRMSVVTQGFLSGRYLPMISTAVSVTAVLKVSANISMSMSESTMESAANFPPIFAREISATSGSFNFSRSNLILVMHSFFALFRCNLKVSMTSSWSLPISAPGKLRVLEIFTLVLNRFFTMM